jgi:hypothetical protein
LKVLVDTSVWADFLNGVDSIEERALARLIAGEDELYTCGVVVAEVFQGLRRSAGRPEIESLFRELVFLEVTGIEPYLRAADVYRRLRGKGVTVRSTIDCLIAVIAEENGCDVLSRDRDLAAIIDSGLVKARACPVGASR